MRSNWIWGCLIASFGLVACDQPPLMSLASSTVTVGEDAVVQFDRPINGKPWNVHWMALVPVTTPDDSTTGRFVVDHGKTAVSIPTSVPGSFEVRLHDQYPSKEHHLIGRVPVRVVERGVSRSTYR